VKQPNVVIKVAVVACSLLLLGGFVSYRAGAFDRVVRPSAQPSEPAAPQQPPPATTQAAPTIMEGSKTGFVAPRLNQ
jgi:hypothetical protein